MNLIHQWPIWITVSVVFFLMFVMNEVGYRVGRIRDADEPDKSRPVTAVLKTTVMGLVALLLGFTYAMASNRFDQRQKLVIDEANAIETCDLRARLLEEPAKTQVRVALKRYTELRVERFDRALDSVKYERTGHAMDAELEKMWSGVENAVKSNLDHALTTQIVPAVNDVIELSATGAWANRNRVPETVLILLAACMVVSSAIVGHWSGQVGRRHLWLWTTMNVLLALVFFMVLDYDRPRRGFIQVSQQPLIDLRDKLGR